MSHGKAHEAARRPHTVLQWIIQITGELLITAGVILLLFRCLATVVDQHRR